MPQVKIMSYRLWIVEILKIVQVVEVVHHRGQKSEIRDQLYP